MEHEVKIRIEKPKDTRGGRREGAGRKRGISPDQLTIQDLLKQLHIKSGGRKYEELLVEDFIRARDTEDRHLTLKYHNLILNKVMAGLQRLEIKDVSENLQQKETAFADALRKLITNKVE